MSKDNPTKKNKKTKVEDSRIFFPQGKIVKIAGKDFTIMPYVLKENREVIKIVMGNMQSIADLKGILANANDAEAIKILVESCATGLTKVYSITLKEKTDWIENNLTLHEEKELLEAIWEVNNFSFLAEKVKGLIEKGKHLQKTQQA